MANRKKALVTGASGFLGSHICEAAHEAGYEVHALIRETSSRQWLQKDWINIHTVGLNKGPELSRLLKNMDAVIHNAGATSACSREDFIKVNIESTQMLAREAIKADVPRFIYISSLAAGGPSEGPFPKTEEDPDCPVSPYGESKKKAEEILYSLREKIHVISLRYPAIYGPRGKEMLSVFKMLSGPFQPLIGLKTLYSSFIYVQDAASAAVAAIEADVPSGSVYYVTDGIDYTTEYLYDRIGEALEHRGRRFHVPLWLVHVAAWWQSDVLKKRSAFTRDKVREFAARFWLASSQKAICELDWKPKVLPKQGFAKTVRWYRYKRWL